MMFLLIFFTFFLLFSCEFINEFNFMKVTAAARNKKFDRQPTIATGQPFEPDYIYKMLTKLKSTDAFKVGVARMSALPF